MKFRIGQLSRLSAAILLALSSLLAISMPIAHASPGNDTCTWIGAGTTGAAVGTDVNFSTVANWSGCSGVAPVTGDSLVFDVSSLNGANVTLSDDIVTNPVFNNISFTGTSSYAYTIGGQPFSLSGGITDTSNAQNEIDNDITLTADQTFSTNSILTIGSVGTSTLDLGTNNLTLNSGTGLVQMQEIMSGTGGLIISAPSGGFGMDFGVASPNFSGPVAINSGLVTLGDIQGLGTGTLTVASGATLEVDNSADNITLNNALNLAGSGVSNQGALADCLGDDSGCDGDNDATNLTLAGDITLSDDAQIGVGATGTPGTGIQNVAITAGLSGAHTISIVPNSGLTLIVNATTNTSNTPNDGGQGGGDVGTPDTGLALVSARIVPVMITTLLATSTLLLLARKLKQGKAFK